MCQKLANNNEANKAQCWNRNAQMLDGVYPICGKILETLNAATV